MMTWVEQRQFIQGVNRSHPHQLKTTTDWQNDVFLKFHDSFLKKESGIDKADAATLVRTLSQKWGVRIEQMYPEKPSNMNYSWGASLGPRHGVIWLDSDMLYPSYVFHEMAHVVVECFRNYDLKRKSKLKEEGHGVLFATILYHWLLEYYQNYDSALRSLEHWFTEPRIYMAPTESYLHMQKLFKNRTLL